MSPMRNAAEKVRQKHEGDLIKFISDVEKRRQCLENGRLLYVAATRAIRKLFLFAAIKPSMKGEVKAATATMLGELWPAIRAEQAPLILLAAGEREEEAHRISTTPCLPQVYRRLTC